MSYLLFIHSLNFKQSFVNFQSDLILRIKERFNFLNNGTHGCRLQIVIKFCYLYFRQFDSSTFPQLL